jgi:thymidylate synthase
MVFDIILVIDQTGGIGKDNSLPWNCREELNIFKAKTQGATLIIGRNTFEALPPLPGRNLVCVSRSHPDGCRTLEEALDQHEGSSVFVAGGAQLYEYTLQRHRDRIEKIHLSVMKESYPCDTFVNLSLEGFVCTEKEEYDAFTHYVMEQDQYGEWQYISLLKNIMQNGISREGRNGGTRSVFGEKMRFDLSQGAFPLVTTRKIFFRGIVEELLFFLRGETNSKILEEKKVNIWKGNTSREFLDSIGKEERKEGMMGPMYGYQYRSFGARYDEETGQALEEGVDQLKYVIDLIKNDPHSRRILLTSYNPSQVFDGVLFPCHSIAIQFYVDGQRLNMMAVSRSQDCFHGFPFNLASYSLLLLIIAKVTNKTPGFLDMVLGDAHIYDSHIPHVREICSRPPLDFPRVSIDKDLNSISDIEALDFSSFTLTNYNSHPGIKADMVV